MKNSRHIALFMIVCCLLFTLVACGGRDVAAKNESDKATDNDNGSVSDNEESGKLPPADASNVLVSYFSATGTTGGSAEKIADVTGGELYEIVPVQAYTQADLAYGNSSCRANQEQNSPTARPAISGSVQDMAKYDVVYLGYPIWWSKAPKIIYTFLESYEFAGKTIVPFCTSGSSPIDGSLPDLRNIASDATWLDGRRFDASATEAQIKEWTDGLDLPSNEEEEDVTDTIYLTINETKIAVKLEKNDAVDALVALLRTADITYTASGYGGFEMVGGLGRSLPRSDVQMTTQAGDVVLYNGDQIVLFYGSNSWSYTKLGTMQLPAAELKNILTACDPVTVKISLN